MRKPTGKIGRAHWRRPEFPLWAALDALKLTAAALCKDLAVTPQQFSYWANGTQWTPLHVVRAIEKRTGRLGEHMRVRLGHWPMVKDKASRRYWRFGKVSFHPNRDNPPRPKLLTVP